LFLPSGSKKKAPDEPGKRREGSRAAFLRRQKKQKPPFPAALSLREENGLYRSEATMANFLMVTMVTMVIKFR
jgi:hypothetical protein